MFITFKWGIQYPMCFYSLPPGCPGQWRTCTSSRSQSAACTSWCSCGCGSASCVLLQPPPSHGCSLPLRAGKTEGRRCWSQGFQTQWDATFNDFKVTLKVYDKIFKGSNLDIIRGQIWLSLCIILDINHKVKYWCYAGARLSWAYFHGQKACQNVIVMCTKTHIYHLLWPFAQLVQQTRKLQRWSEKNKTRCKTKKVLKSRLNPGNCLLHLVWLLKCALNTNVIIWH